MSNLLKSVIVVMAAMLGALSPLGAQADEVIDQGGIAHLAIEDYNPQDPSKSVVYLQLDATNAGVGLDSRSDDLRVEVYDRKAGSGVLQGADDAGFVPRQMNTYQLKVRTGEIVWAVYDSGFMLAAGSIDLRWVEDGSAPDVYGADGYYLVNGRQWLTECEPYSQTERCRTDIWATQAREVSPGAFANVNGWVFNNLTYRPSERSLWANNPLGGYGRVGHQGSWTAKDGRNWRVECDTANSGRGGCRAYAEATVVVPTNSSATSFRWETKFIFNNIVRFKG